MLDRPSAPDPPEEPGAPKRRRGRDRPQERDRQNRQDGSGSRNDADGGNGGVGTGGRGGPRGGRHRSGDSSYRGDGPGRHAAPDTHSRAGATDGRGEQAGYARAVRATAAGDTLLDQAVADVRRWHQQQASEAGVARYWRPGVHAARDGGATEQAAGAAEAALTAPSDLPATRDWLRRPDRPATLTETRPYRQEGGLEHPSRKHQQALEEAVSGGGSAAAPFTDPTQWMHRLNDGGPGANPLRGSNCLDCSLAAISTWHGEPAVSAPRFAAYQPAGGLDESGEAHGMHRAERWLGNQYRFIGVGATALETLAATLHGGGHGAAAHIVHTWPGGRTHAWNAFNYRETIIWADPQHGVTSQQPVYRRVLRVWAIVMDREGEAL